MESLYGAWNIEANNTFRKGRRKLCLAVCTETHFLAPVLVETVHNAGKISCISYGTAAGIPPHRMALDCPCPWEWKNYVR